METTLFILKRQFSYNFIVIFPPILNLFTKGKSMSVISIQASPVSASSRLSNAAILYQVPAAEAARLYLRSQQLRTLLASGAFLAVDGRFCLNRSPFISHGRLTRHAVLHPDQCCLGFSRRSFRQLPTGMVAYSSRSLKQLELKALPTAFTEQLLKKNASSYALLATLPPTFTGTALALLKNRGYSQTAAAELLDIDITTFFRFVHSATPKRNMVFALGFLLQLEAPLFDDLVRKAGITYTLTNSDNIIQMLRGVCPNPGLRYCNQVLASAGCEKLPAQPDFWME